jgi:flagellar FliJ protein
MKRFRFPLQPVAVLRAHHEMRALGAFSLALQACNRAETECTVVRDRVCRFEAALVYARRERFSPPDVVQAFAAYQQECVVEAAAEQAVIVAHSVLKQRRMDYLEARREVEILRRLEQKARTLHRFDAGREEQAGFDDLAVGRFGSRRTGISV